MLVKNAALFIRYKNFIFLFPKIRQYSNEFSACSDSKTVFRTEEQIKININLIKNISAQSSSKAFISKLKQNGYIYIVDPETAKTVASYLTDNWKDGYIFEANPGPGILSKSILKMGASHLRVFEKNKEFLPELKDLASQYPNLDVISEDLMFLPSLDYGISVDDLNEVEKFFHKIPEYPWSNGVTFRLFSIISSKKSIKFLRYLLAALPTKSSVFVYGRCEFYLLLTELEYKYMKATPKENFSTYRWSTVLYNLFFDIKYLEKFNSESFFPLPGSRRKMKENSAISFYLVKLIPKPELFASYSDCSKLPDLYFFVRHHLLKRSALVIPTMEGWIPACGPRLIKEGMSVLTKFGDLSPTQILMLFNQFSSWPEYEDSTFHAAVQRFYGKEGFIYEDDG